MGVSGLFPMHVMARNNREITVQPEAIGESHLPDSPAKTSYSWAAVGRRILAGQIIAIFGFLIPVVAHACCEATARCNTNLDDPSLALERNRAVRYQTRRTYRG